MDEYTRQAYLASLGVENYMPRFRLSVAPESTACSLPVSKINELPASYETPALNLESHQIIVQHNPLQSPRINPISISEVLRDLGDKQHPISVAPLAPALMTPKIDEIISPFSLSIWRPQNGLLIIDARNTQLALPTELLLRNILSALLGAPIALGREEVLRWPLIENDSIPHTEEDARNALHVWLEVEIEQRQTKRVLLLGENAARYFLSDNFHYDQSLWQWLNIPPSIVQALIAPSLVQLLQQPLLKRNLWQSSAPLRTPV